MVQNRPVRTFAHKNRWQRLPGILVALVFCTAFAVTSGTSMAQSEPGPRPDDVPLYYDPENVFPENQRPVLVSDAERLTSTDIPILVYVRTATIDEAVEEQSQAFADSVRTGWDIATEPGADDGMVILLSWVPEQKDQSSIVISWGEHTFDESGLTPEYVNNVLNTTMRPFLESGLPFEAMFAGMREIRYGGIYFPPPVAPLTPTQDAVHQVVTIAGPLAAVATPVTFVYLSLRQGFGASASRRRMYKVILAVLALVALLAIMSVYGRSAIGVASALLILVSLAIQTWLWTHPSGRRQKTGVRAVPPTSRRARKRHQARAMALPDVREVRS